MKKIEDCAKIVEVKMDALIADAKEKGQERIDYLKEINHATKKVKNDDGSEEDKELTFVEIRRMYCQKFYPELTKKKAKKKTKSFHDAIDAL